MSKELTVSNSQPLSAFNSEAAFETAQRMAKALASSDLVPQTFKGNIANCIIALEVASRTGSSILAVTQSLNIIHGRPSWSSAYIIAALNSCGRFAPIRFDIQGEGDDMTCYAWTIDKAGERLEGPPVSIKMAKEEGWYNKAGSKWKTLPKLMCMYRSAAFFGRLYAPDILFGMRSDDEIYETIDITPSSKTVVSETPKSAIALNDKIKAKKAPPKPVELEPEAVHTGPVISPESPKTQESEQTQRPEQGPEFF